MADGNLSVDIVTADHPVWSGQATFVTAPAQTGSLGVYPRHQPMLALLGDGEIRIDLPDGAAPVKANVTGGFLSVDSDQVTVVADRARLVS